NDGNNGSGNDDKEKDNGNNSDSVPGQDKKVDIEDNTDNECNENAGSSVKEPKPGKNQEELDKALKEVLVSEHAVTDNSGKKEEKSQDMEKAIKQVLVSEHAIKDNENNSSEDNDSNNNGEESQEQNNEQLNNSDKVKEKEEKDQNQEVKIKNKEYPENLLVSDTIINDDTNKDKNKDKSKEAPDNSNGQNKSLDDILVADQVIDGGKNKTPKEKDSERSQNTNNKTLKMKSLDDILVADDVSKEENKEKEKISATNDQDNDLIVTEETGEKIDEEKNTEYTDEEIENETSGPDSIVVKIEPEPVDYSVVDFNDDNELDFKDYTQFVIWWNTNNPAGDITSQPDVEKAIANDTALSDSIYFIPDGKIDHEDHMLFALLYNNYQQEKNELITEKPGIAKKVAMSSVKGLTWESEMYETGGHFTVTLNTGKVRNYLGSEITLDYDNTRLRLVGVTAQSAENETEGNTMVLYRVTDGTVTVSAILLSDYAATVPENLLDFEFEVIHDGAFSINLTGLDIRNIYNKQIDMSVETTTLTGEALRSQEVNPSSFGISQNYPNPFNPTTSIEYSMSEPGYVTISIFNVNGQQITNLVSGFKEAGVYSTVWNASSCAAGVYFCAITSNGMTKFRKMTLLK
ncbi:MAG: T9SS type A sorting domain-containing protein, partial [Candidatus Latescibacteria bacterium]|nr:T9SS type A sorting domain-containing protein [Candidatus Latescibacterota bacterium]